MSSSAAVQAAVHRAHQLLAPSHTQGSPPIGPGPPPQWPRHASLAARCRRPRLRVLAVASSKVRGGGGGGSSVPASEQQHEHGGQPPQQDQPAVLPPPQQAPAEAAQERAAAPAAAAAPAWLTGRNLAFAGSAVTILLLTVFRKEIAPVAKWVVMQAGGLSDKSKIGDISVESVATTLAVGLTLWWSYAEFQKSNERLSVMQALEASMEAQQAALEERLAAVEAREAALEARLAALEEQQRGGSGS